MKLLMERWRGFLSERAYTMGALPAGSNSKICPQGEEQVGWKDINEPKCRPEPTVKPPGMIKIKGIKKLVEYIYNHPNQAIKIEHEAGTSRKFGGGKEVTLPFAYGEWTSIINPADNMGWDIIVVPSSDSNENNLIPVGHVAYNEFKPSAIGNDKIVIAPDGKYTEQDKQLVEEVFKEFQFFDAPVWY